MKRAWQRYLVAGAVAYAVFLALTVPAERIYAMFGDKLKDVKLWEVSGTLWNGRAAVAQIGPRRLENVEWHVQPWALLMGRAQAATTFRTEQGPAEMVIGRGLGGAWHLRDVRMRLPAGVLEPVFRLGPGQLGGRVDLALDELSFRPGEITAAEGKVTWADAAIVAPWPTPLGGLELAVEPDNGNYRGALRDRGGMLNAQGVLTLKPDGTYQFTATLAPRDARRAPQLQNGLQILGVPQPDGRYKISTGGRLPLPAKVG